jgi:hypothetical protein
VPAGAPYDDFPIKASVSLEKQFDARVFLILSWKSSAKPRPVSAVSRLIRFSYGKFRGIPHLSTKNFRLVPLSFDKM